MLKTGFRSGKNHMISKAGKQSPEINPADRHDSPCTSLKPCREFLYDFRFGLKILALFLSLRYYFITGLTLYPAFLNKLITPNSPPKCAEPTAKKTLSFFIISGIC